MKIKIILKTTWSFSTWIISTFTLLLAGLLTFAYQIPALLLFMAGIVIFPPVGKLINKRFSFKIPTLLKVGLFVALFIFSIEKLPPSTKTTNVQLTNQIAVPPPTAQIQQVKQTSVKNKADDEATSPKETGFAQKRYEDIANAYCGERRSSTRRYTILELSEGADGKAELKPITTKQGNKLTQEDCVRAITALTFSGYTEHIEDVVTQRYWQNMGQFEANYSLGIPDDKSKTTESGFLVPDETETWAYYGSNGQKLYLYFKNGILTKWTQNY